MTVNELHKITKALIAQGNGELDVALVSYGCGMDWDTTNFEVVLVSTEKLQDNNWYPKTYRKNEEGRNKEIEGVPFVYLEAGQS